MRRAVNDTLSLLLRAMIAVVVASGFTACKDKVPSDPRSPPKPRMESGAGGFSTVAMHARGMRARLSSAGDRTSGV